MNPSQPSRRRRGYTLAAEPLESRDLMTGGAGSTFAIEPGTIAQANQPAAVKFTIDTTHFTMPRGGFTLGIDVVPGSNSQLKPSIASAAGPTGRMLRLSHAAYAAHLPNATVAAGQLTSAVQTNIQLQPGSSSESFTLNVRGQGGTTGDYLLGFYLPGDANGDGKVDPTDIAAIKAAFGSKAGSTQYTFDLDANRDGRINIADMRVARKNLGVATTVSPMVSASLDPDSQGPIKDRSLIAPSAHFGGVATPGAVLKYEEVDSKVQPVATTANEAGVYSIIVPVPVGSATFKVTSLDSFGQVISGTLSPVTYNPDAAMNRTPQDSGDSTGSNG
jgi:hypothetical protein